MIEQTILVWDEPHHLAFGMDRSDLYFRSCVPSIVDDFELLSTPQGGTRATRTTSVTVLGWFRWAKGVALWVGLKKVHRFVFSNWQRLASLSSNIPFAALLAGCTRLRRRDIGLLRPLAALLLYAVLFLAHPLFAGMPVVVP